ncbi:MAG: nitrate/nitrite transporter NrtS [Chloroflexaceae bacterium]|nr:nitrate/nitrite transporter NrtS [Chloroflexaceae bacterium]
MKALKAYFRALVDPSLAPTAIKVAILVGSLLFLLNHGPALVQGKMSQERWISSLLTYLVPYGVNIHGQYISRSRQLKTLGSSWGVNWGWVESVTASNSSQTQRIYAL